MTYGFAILDHVTLDDTSIRNALQICHAMSSSSGVKENAYIELVLATFPIPKDNFHFSYEPVCSFHSGIHKVGSTFDKIRAMTCQPMLSMVRSGTKLTENVYQVNLLC